MSVLFLGINPQRPQCVYAGSNDRLHLSENGGNTCRSLYTPRPELVVWGLVVDPQQSDVLHIGTIRGVYKSENGGVTWIGAGLSENVIWSPTIDSEQTLYAGTFDPSDV